MRPGLVGYPGHGPTPEPVGLVGEMSLDILVGGATDDVLISSLLIGGAYYGGSRSYWFPVDPAAPDRGQISATTPRRTNPASWSA